MQKKYVSAADALKKIQRYCAYQDRCHSEVRTKLYDIGVYGDTLEEIMAELIKERFLDEERFARSYTRGKFRLKQWGRVRIQQELKLRKISVYCIKKGMTEIAEADYLATLKSVLEKKIADYSIKYDPYTTKQKAAQYAIGRGYESNLVWDMFRVLEGDV